MIKINKEQVYLVKDNEEHSIGFLLAEDLDEARIKLKKLKITNKELKGSKVLIK